MSRWEKVEEDRWNRVPGWEGRLLSGWQSSQSIFISEAMEFSAAWLTHGCRARRHSPGFPRAALPQQGHWGGYQLLLPTPSGRLLPLLLTLWPIICSVPMGSCEPETPPGFRPPLFGCWPPWQLFGDSWPWLSRGKEGKGWEESRVLH